MATFILHFLLALFCLVGALATYFKLENSDSRETIKEHIFLFFAFFVGYHLSLSLPFWFSSGDLVAMAWGYNIAIGFLFLLLAPMYSVMAFQTFGIPIKKIGFFIKIFLLLGLCIILIQVVDFRLPIIDGSGFIFWNANLVSSALISFASAMVAVAWMIIYFKNKPDNLSFGENAKARIYTAGGFMFSIASIYFIAHNVAMIITAFIFVTLGTLFLTGIEIFPKKQEITP